MDNQQQGVVLNQLSRILFNKAALLWQFSIVLQLTAGIVGVIVSVISPSTNISIFWAGIVIIFLAFSYFLKYLYENKYEIAETMRRQSVLTEGLNWPIARTQFNEWKSRAGKSALAQLSREIRPADYYETTARFSPKKLIEMTFESVFWTKSLYKKIRSILYIILAVFITLFSVLLSFPPAIGVGQTMQIYLIYSTYLFIPVLLSIDFIGFLLKLSRNISALREIEGDLERVGNNPAPSIEETMRLVSEYNSVVSSGMPIPNWLFGLCHDEIQKCWDL